MQTLKPFTFVLPVVFASAGLVACSPDEPDAVRESTTASEAPGASAEQAAPATTVRSAPEVIIAARGGFMPEGVEYDRAKERFLAGSFVDGTIYEIGFDGSVTPFVTDADLVSSVGIEADESRGRLLVANSNAAAFGMPVGAPEGPRRAQLGVYDLATGKRLAMVDLGAVVDTANDAVFFANDVAVADDGTAFVTDTIRNVVYRVDTDYNAGIHYSFDATEGLALNGIEWHPDGYLLISDVGNGALYRLPTAAGGVAEVVSVPGALPGADGIVWRADGALVVVQNSTTDGRLVALTSEDGWVSAPILEVATHEGQSTAAAAVGDDVYMVQPHFADQNPPTIRRALF
jgi:hypothetical protein